MVSKPPGSPSSTRATYVNKTSTIWLVPIPLVIYGNCWFIGPANPRVLDAHTAGGSAEDQYDRPIAPDIAYSIRRAVQPRCVRRKGYCAGREAVGYGLGFGDELLDFDLGQSVALGPKNVASVLRHTSSIRDFLSDVHHSLSALIHSIPFHHRRIGCVAFSMCESIINR